MSLNHVALKHLASSGFHKTGAVMFHKNWLDTITHYWILFIILWPIFAMYRNVQHYSRKLKYFFHHSRKLFWPYPSVCRVRVRRVIERHGRGYKSLRGGKTPRSLKSHKWHLKQNVEKKHVFTIKTWAFAIYGFWEHANWLKDVFGIKWQLTSHEGLWSFFDKMTKTCRVLCKNILSPEEAASTPWKRRNKTASANISPKAPAAVHQRCLKMWNPSQQQQFTRFSFGSFADTLATAAGGPATGDRGQMQTRPPPPIEIPQHCHCLK